MQQRGEHGRDSASDLAVCLSLLIHEGRVAVSAHPSDIADSDALPLLTEMDSLARNELGLDLPALSEEAALWAARLFYQLCRFTVCRDIPEQQIGFACTIPFPGPRCPGTDWSVDLTLHHLPKLFRLARHLSNADPLLEQLKQIAKAWPLSSVGIPELSELTLESFVVDAGLRRLYADRIIAAADTVRLGHPQIDDMLRADLWMHRDLAPQIATKLFIQDHETP